MGNIRQSYPAHIVRPQCHLPKRGMQIRLLLIMVLDHGYVRFAPLGMVERMKVETICSGCWTEFQMCRRHRGCTFDCFVSVDRIGV